MSGGQLMHTFEAHSDEVWAAAISPDGRDLVISTNLTGRHNLWRVPLAGGFPVQLTRSDDRQWGTVFSPDGKTVVFGSDHAGAEMFDLYAVPREGGPVINLTSTEDATESGEVFSPDGRWLAFRQRRKSAASANIAVMEFGSRHVRVLTDEKLPQMQWSVVTFSADGREIIANRSDITGTTGAVWRIDVATGAAKPALRNAKSRLNLAVDTSVDGRWLSLTIETSEGRRQAALYDTRSDRMTLLHPDSWEQRAGRFAPDSGSVLFVSNVNGRDIVYQYDVASGQSNALPLPAGANAGVGPHISAYATLHWPLRRAARASPWLVTASRRFAAAHRVVASRLELRTADPRSAMPVTHAASAGLS